MPAPKRDTAKSAAASSAARPLRKTALQPAADTPPCPPLRHFEVRRSGIHGWGAFATRAIRPDTRLGVYEGRRYPANASGEMASSDQLTYVFGLSDGTMIDAAEGGNATRHLNHSCEPNCAAYEETGADGRLVIAVYALHPIRRGDELFIDYSLDVEPERAAQYRCLCGTPSCRGSMVAPPADEGASG